MGKWRGLADVWKAVLGEEEGRRQNFLVDGGSVGIAEKEQSMTSSRLLV